MTDIKEQAQQLIELNEKRTPGEWEVGSTPINVVCSRVTLCSMAGALAAKLADFESQQRSNATFIAHTANHAPAIAQAYLDKCEEVERLREETSIGSGPRVIIRQIENKFRAVLYDKSGRVYDIVEAPSLLRLHKHWAGFFPQALGEKNDKTK